VIPSILYYMSRDRGFPENEILDALAVAGLFGNVIRTNASISGAEAGCQAEIGSACSMAAAAAATLFGLSIDQIEYAAEIAMEHNLGLTCDPSAAWCRSPASSETPSRPARAELRQSLPLPLRHAEHFLRRDRHHDVPHGSRHEREVPRDLPRRARADLPGALSRPDPQKSAGVACRHGAFLARARRSEKTAENFIFSLATAAACSIVQ
jgi:hypothetical protein